jgi:hypothetical protein
MFGGGSFARNKIVPKPLGGVQASVPVVRQSVPCKIG